MFEGREKDGPRCPLTSVSIMRAHLQLNFSERDGARDALQVFVYL